MNPPTGYWVEVTLRLYVPRDGGTVFADPSDIAQDVGRAVYCLTGGSTHTRESLERAPEYLGRCFDVSVCGLKVIEDQ